MKKKDIVKTHQEFNKVISSKNKVANTIIAPVLDFMQTMPAFVYLIPAVAFFGIGMVPGVFASLIFAIPPTVRFTNLGIRQVSDELVEAADETPKPVEVDVVRKTKKKRPTKKSK